MSDLAAGAGGSPGRYGPFHRLESTSQTVATGQKQAETGELWGLPARGSDRPTVKAYRGPLPAGLAGIEFYTNVSPDDGTPPFRASWSGPRDGVRVEDGYAKISAVAIHQRMA